MAEVAHHPSSEDPAGAADANLSKTDELEDGEFPEPPVKPPAADAATTTASTLATTPAVSRLQELEQLGAGGVYIPPARRRQLEAQQQQQQAQPVATTTANSAVSVQRRTWQEQKRVVHGTINRLNASTIKPLIHQLFQNVNLIRLRGVLARSLLQAAVSAPRYSNVYAALVAVINTKLPEVGELIVHRAILAFRRHFARREKTSCLAMALFMGHLFHQAVLHELSMLQLLSLLLDEPTDDSVEVAVPLLQTIGYALLEVSPTGVRAVLERLRALLHEGTINARVQYKVEQLLAQRKTGFRDLTPPIPNELDLVERDEQITFEIGIDQDDIQKEEHLDIFRVDPEYEENEKVWTEIRNEILGLGGSNSDDDDGDEETDDDEEESENEQEDDANPELAIVTADAKTTTVAVQDLSESDLIHLRRTIYLTIMSSATFEECTHKLTKVSIPPGREEELINMLIECCSQERTFLRYYGLISARFCLLDDRWKQAFMESFATQYNTIHRLETNKLRNVAKLFAHLLHSDSIPWSVLTNIHLNEQETTSSSRIFVKILVQEMAEAIGISKLKERFETTNEEMVDWYKGMFPKDNVRNTRYAINFFTSIGLGPLTDDLREFLKNAPKLIMEQAKQSALAKQEDDDSSSVSSTSSSSLSSSSSGSSSSSSSYSSSSSSSSSSESRRRRRRRRRRRSPSSSSSSTSSRSSFSSSSESSRRRRSSRKRRDRDSPSRSPERKQADDAPNRNADDGNRGEDKSRRSKPDDDKRRRRQDSISEERTSRRRPSRSDERRRRPQASTSPEERRGRRRRSDINGRQDSRSPSSDRDADDRRNRRSRSGSSNRSPPNGQRRRNSRSSSPSERRSGSDDAGVRRRQHDSASPPREEHRRSRSPRRDRRDYDDERRGRRSDERRRRHSRSSSPGRDRRSRRRNDPSRSRSPDSRSSLSEDEGRRGDKRKRRAASDSRSPSSDRDGRKRSSKRSRGFSPR